MLVDRPGDESNGASSPRIPSLGGFGETTVPQRRASARSCLVANFGGGRSLESTNQGYRATREVKTFNLIGWGSLGGVGGPRTAPLSAPIKTERKSNLLRRRILGGIPPENENSTFGPLRGPQVMRQ